MYSGPSKGRENITLFLSAKVLQMSSTSQRADLLLRFSQKLGRLWIRWTVQIFC